MKFEYYPNPNFIILANPNLNTIKFVDYSKNSFFFLSKDFLKNSYTPKKKTPKERALEKTLAATKLVEDGSCFTDPEKR